MRPTKKKGSKVRAKPLPVEVTKEEFRAIQKTIQYKKKKRKYFIANLIAWGSGLRISEVCHLKPEDFDFKQDSIRVNMGKNSKDRIVPIPKEMQEWHMEFIPIKCKQRSLQKALVIYARKAGVLANKPKAHFHSLRHGFATHCLRCGIDLPHIQGNLGHEDLSTTSIYLNLAPTERIKKYQENFGRV